MRPGVATTMLGILERRVAAFTLYGIPPKNAATLDGNSVINRVTRSSARKVNEKFQVLWPGACEFIFSGDTKQFWGDLAQNALGAHAM